MTEAQFYGPEEVKRHNCVYKKINDSNYVPSMRSIEKFIEAIERQHEKDSDSLILVHCKNGQSRSGFYVASYLITKKQYSVEVALNTIKNAKKPGIDFPSYRKKLFKRYEDKPVVKIKADK